MLLSLSYCTPFFPLNPPAQPSLAVQELLHSTPSELGWEIDRIEQDFVIATPCIATESLLRLQDFLQTTLKSLGYHKEYCSQNSLVQSLSLKQTGPIVACIKTLPQSLALGT